MHKVALILVCLFIAASAQYVSEHGYKAEASHNGPYEFEDENNRQEIDRFTYGVNDPQSGNPDSQAEKRRDGLVGMFMIRDADGKRRIVHYKKKGFHAVIHSIDYALHPKTESKIYAHAFEHAKKYHEQEQEQENEQYSNDDAEYDDDSEFDQPIKADDLSKFVTLKTKNNGYELKWNQGSQLSRKLKKGGNKEKFQSFKNINQDEDEDEDDDDYASAGISYFPKFSKKAFKKQEKQRPTNTDEAREFVGKSNLSFENDPTAEQRGTQRLKNNTEQIQTTTQAAVTQHIVKNFNREQEVFIQNEASQPQSSQVIQEGQQVLRINEGPTQPKNGQSHGAQNVQQQNTSPRPLPQGAAQQNNHQNSHEHNVHNGQILPTPAPQNQQSQPQETGFQNSQILNEQQQVGLVTNHSQSQAFSQGNATQVGAENNHHGHRHNGNNGQIPPPPAPQNQQPQGLPSPSVAQEIRSQSNQVFNVQKQVIYEIPQQQPLPLSQGASTQVSAPVDAQNNHQHYRNNGHIGQLPSAPLPQNQQPQNTPISARPQDIGSQNNESFNEQQQTLVQGPVIQVTSQAVGSQHQIHYNGHTVQNGRNIHNGQQHLNPQNQQPIASQTLAPQSLLQTSVTPINNIGQQNQQTVTPSPVPLPQGTGQQQNHEDYRGQISHNRSNQQQAHVPQNQRQQQELPIAVLQNQQQFETLPQILSLVDVSQNNQLHHRGHNGQENQAQVSQNIQINFSQAQNGQTQVVLPQPTQQGVSERNNIQHYYQLSAHNVQNGDQNIVSTPVSQNQKTSPLAVTPAVGTQTNEQAPAQLNQLQRPGTSLTIGSLNNDQNQHNHTQSSHSQSQTTLNQQQQNIVVAQGSTSANQQKLPIFPLTSTTTAPKTVGSQYNNSLDYYHGLNGQQLQGLASPSVLFAQQVQTSTLNQSQIPINPLSATSASPLPPITGSQYNNQFYHYHGSNEQVQGSSPPNQQIVPISTSAPQVQLSGSRNNNQQQHQYRGHNGYFSVHENQQQYLPQTDASQASTVQPNSQVSGQQNNHQNNHWDNRQQTQSVIHQTIAAVPSQQILPPVPQSQNNLNFNNGQTQALASTPSPNTLPQAGGAQAQNNHHHHHPQGITVQQLQGQAEQQLSLSSTPQPFPQIVSNQNNNQPLPQTGNNFQHQHVHGQQHQAQIARPQNQQQQQSPAIAGAQVSEPEKAGSQLAGPQEGRLQNNFNEHQRQTELQGLIQNQQHETRPLTQEIISQNNQQRQNGQTEQYSPLHIQQNQQPISELLIRQNGQTEQQSPPQVQQNQQPMPEILIPQPFSAVVQSENTLQQYQENLDRQFQALSTQNQRFKILAPEVDEPLRNSARSNGNERQQRIPSQNQQHQPRSDTPQRRPEVVELQNNSRQSRPQTPIRQINNLQVPQSFSSRPAPQANVERQWRLIKVSQPTETQSTVLEGERSRRVSKKGHQYFKNYNSSL